MYLNGLSSWLKARNKLEEVWKYIDGYHGRYQVSTNGNVRRCLKNGTYKIMKQQDTRGYKTVHLSWNNEAKVIQIHRLVAKSFIANPYNLPQVDHINRVRDDNRVDNLRWVTRSENQLNRCDSDNLTFNGVTKHISEWEKETGIHFQTIRRRLENGWSVEKALTTKVRPLKELYDRHNPPNKKIRTLCKEKRVRFGVLAKEIGITRTSLARKLRYELPNKEQEKMIKSILLISEREVV